jgi:hypothetical protein
METTHMRETSGAGVWTRRAALGRRVVHPPDALSCGPIEGSYCEVASCAGGDRVRDPGRQVRKESMRYPFRINEILYFV